MENNELSSGDIIRSKRVLNILNNFENNQNNEILNNNELLERININIDSNELSNILNISLLLNQSSQEFYSNNIEKNFELFEKFKSIEIPNMKKNLEFPGLYYHKNGYLVFILSTFNNISLSSKVIDFYKFKNSNDIRTY